MSNTDGPNPQPPANDGPTGDGDERWIAAVVDRLVSRAQAGDANSEMQTDTEGKSIHS